MIGDGDRKIWVRGGREKSEFTKKWSDISIIMEMKKGIFLGKEDTEKDGLGWQRPPMWTTSDARLSDPYQLLFKLHRNTVNLPKLLHFGTSIPDL